MRVLIVSDIHGNQAALETVFSVTVGQYDTVWCLGDVVGYGPRPNECISLVREQAALCVIGNHDWAVLGRSGINVDDFNPQARQAVLWTRQQLTVENRAYLEALPADPQVPLDAPDFLVTHASPREPVWEYILTPGVALLNFGVFGQRFGLVGHTHKPAIYRWALQTALARAQGPDEGEASAQVATVQHLLPRADEIFALPTDGTQRLLLNPGSVGQPRDNDARAAYALLDLAQMTWQYSRVAYPVDLTQSQMRSAGLPKRLIDRLSFGW